ncbi:phage terminase large subunit [Hydrogenimonas thermophila]|uniref:Phage uncharacterized protein (Putative large terminase), C-terminal domain-containing protein n=1 Tax=Hydrogenimonas thermophila TaxID=223786 RepID=A0A1I5RQI5_9BACT|nr:phage terminase large subunit [Hydrogenimonas thermophila]SFP60802.1 phage uncharacterized protein (putative large terminase), C-terminal domain-containing protein [Hydrogenimonas thermophila]
MIELEDLKLYLKSLPNEIRDPVDLKKAKRDFFYCIKNYFPHHIAFSKQETSAFRKFVYSKLDTLTKTDKEILLTAYRGAAKTTTVSNLYLLWKLTHKEKRFFIIISSTETLAKDIFDLIKEELEHNTHFKQDFNIEVIKSTTTEIVIKVDDFLCKIACYGAGAKIRGKRFLSFRPDLIILDDIENDENVLSKTQRDKLYNWYKKVVKKLPARGSHYNIIIVGTILHHDSLLSRIKDSVDFYQNFPLVLNFKTWKLDNLALDVDELKKEYAEDKEAFLQEYQNIPLSKDALTFPHYKTFDAMPKCDFYSIGVDPSMGKAKGDYFAIAIIGWQKKAKKLYLSAKGYKKNPTDMIYTITQTYIRYSKIARTIIAIETVAYQEFFKDVFKRHAKDTGLLIPVKEFKNNIPKEIRINSLAPLIKDETILIDSSSHLLIDELDTYPKSAHDDLLDASEMAKRAIDTGGGVDYELVRKKQRAFKALKRLKFA